MKFKKGQQVLVSGEGNEVYEVTVVDRKKKRIGVNGCWESMENCVIIPANKKKQLYTVTYFNGDWGELAKGE